MGSLSIQTKTPACFICPETGISAAMDPAGMNLKRAMTGKLISLKVFTAGPGRGSPGPLLVLRESIILKLTEILLEMFDGW